MSSVTLEDVVRRVYGTWTGYVLALKMNAGGSQTKEKDQWLQEVTCEYLTSTPDLMADELADWIDNILDTEFDLILDDGSTDSVADLLVKCSGFIRAGDADSLQKCIERLPTEEAVKSATSTSKKAEGEEDSSDDDEGGEEAPGEGDASGAKERAPRMVTDDDGWTTIVSRK
uniref:Pre-rRNA-processing protein TSR2 homolog n=2 Tax=Steinernema glaseri TaxID=37863 RepID=A0A1I7Z7K0_9BILA